MVVLGSEVSPDISRSTLRSNVFVFVQKDFSFSSPTWWRCVEQRRRRLITILSQLIILHIDSV